LARKTIVHKGYHGTIEVKTDDFSLHGTILFLDEEITYKGETFEDLEVEFSKAVNAHIKSCLDSGQEPPFSEE
jgi:predicted HicB family RNase H-like nuclease